MKPYVPSFWHYKIYLEPSLVTFFFKAENRKMLLCDTGKPGLLRYYFCWHSLCYSAAWWLSPRQCIISPMRTIIIRAVWMGRHDVEMQTWWWRSTQGRFSKMNKYKKLFFSFYTCTELNISWHLRATEGDKLESPARKNELSHLVTYWEWGTWAALFFYTHLGGTWHSRPWLSVSLRHSVWGSCQCG